MVDYVFAPNDPVCLPVVGTTARFPVRRVLCVGKNYAAHVREMGGTQGRDPVVFTKSATTLVESGETVRYPANTCDMHYEVELVAAIGPDGVFGYGVGIDLTRRDLQGKAKKDGAPWDRAKNFPDSAPCSAITPAADVDLSGARIVLRKNGTIVQAAKLSDMIWSVDAIISHLQDDMGLASGDLIYTGTPEGVGPVVPGDDLEGGVEGLAPIRVRIV